MYLLSTCILFITSTLLYNNESVQAVPTTTEPSLIRAPLIRRHKNIVDSVLSQQKKYKRDPFQSSLYNYEATTYLIELAVGTPFQNFTVAIDTGSSDTWVPSTSCPSTNCPFNRFDPTKSSSFQNINIPFNIKYGAGAANGTFGKDTITIGHVQVPNQQFGLASAAEDIFDPTPNTTSTNSTSNNNEPTSNGILGLGYPLLTSTYATGNPYNPVVFNMVEQKLIANPIFSIYMNGKSATGWAGEIIFGGIDQSKYTGELVYVPNVPAIPSNEGDDNSHYAFWMVYAQGIALNGTRNDQTISLSSPSSSLNTIATDPRVFILDTGTTLTYLPNDIAQTIVESVTDKYTYNSNLQAYAVDCLLSESSATIQFQIATSSKSNSKPVTVSVLVSNLIFPLDGSNGANLCLFGIAPNDPTGVVGGDNKNGSMKINLSKEVMLVGESVLRHVYAVFDIGQNRIGLAAANGVGGTVNGVSASSNAMVIDPNMRSLKLIVGTALLFFFFG